MKKTIAKNVRHSSKMKNPKHKVEKVMHEFSEGTLHSGSGHKVTSRKQAEAIALSEARKAGARIPKKRG
jgi:Family of unknown function (DUF6496)